MPVEVLRDAARRAVAISSSHQVAKEIGKSAPWLRNFIAGADPHPATLRRLAEWYVRSAATARELDADTAAAALALLLDAVPEEKRAAATERVLASIREAHREHAAVVPRWAGE